VAPPGAARIPSAASSASAGLASGCGHVFASELAGFATVTRATSAVTRCPRVELPSAHEPRHNLARSRVGEAANYEPPLR
jgi:hypothetical protein